MKKVLSTVLVAGMFAFYACGPSQQEKEADEKARQDSINAAMQMDSMAKANEAAAAAANMAADTANKMMADTASAH